MAENQTPEEEIDKELNDLETLIPAMSVSVPASPSKREVDDNLIPNEMLLALYGELLDMTRQSTVETSEYINNFAEMIFNGGDGSSASKEALVNLMKLKMDASNNMAKIADLMTRITLKDRYTTDFRHLNASQTNNINIQGSKKELLKALNKKKQKEQNEE